MKERYQYCGAYFLLYYLFYLCSIKLERKAVNETRLDEKEEEKEEEKDDDDDDDDDDDPLRINPILSLFIKLVKTYPSCF